MDKWKPTYEIIISDKNWFFLDDFSYEIDHCVSLEGVTKDSGRWSLPISYSEVLCVKRPTPDSEMWIVFGAAKFCIRLIFGLNPSIKFWKYF